MIVTRENQTLFLGTWEYNAALIISTLAKIVKEHGGGEKWQELHDKIKNILDAADKANNF